MSAILWACSLAALAAAADPVAAKVKHTEIVFKLRAGVQPRLAAVVANVSGLAPPQRIFRHGGKFEAKHVKFGLDRWYVAESKGLDERALGALEAQASIVEQRGIRPTHRMVQMPSPFTPDDPEYGDQSEPPHSFSPPSFRPCLLQTHPSHLTRRRLAHALSGHFPALSMESAWQYSTGDPSVVVAVVDSGIDMTHQDFRNNQWTNEGEICGDGVDD